MSVDFETFLNEINLRTSSNLRSVTEFEKFVINQERKYKLGSDSVNSVVSHLGSNHVFKKVNFFQNNAINCKDWTKQQFINARQCEKAIRDSFEIDPGLQQYFNLNNVVFYYDNHEGYVIEEKMNGDDFRKYVKKLYMLVVSRCITLQEFQVRVSMILAVITDIIYRMYKLGINHNDLHDRNIFLKTEPCQYRLGDKTVFLDITPVIFDFDWTTVYPNVPLHPIMQCVKQRFEVYERQYNKRLECDLAYESQMNTNNGKRNYPLNITKDCDFFAQHKRFSWDQRDQVSQSIDVARFMLFFLQILHICINEQNDLLISPMECPTVSEESNVFMREDEWVVFDEFPILLNIFDQFRLREFRVKECRDLMEKIVSVAEGGGKKSRKGKKGQKVINVR